MVAIDCLAGAGLWRGGEELHCAAAGGEGRAPRHRRERRSSACGASARPRSSAGSCCRRWRRRAGSIRRPEGRGYEASAHHPARSVRHFRVRACGRARRMGGVRLVRVLGCQPERSPARRARRSAAAFSASTTLGWSTLVQIVEASEEDRRAAIEMLAQRLVERFGAPDVATARAAAEEEIAFAASLCNHPQDTLIAVHRAHEDGAIREAFRTLRPQGRAEAAARVFLPRGRGRGRAAGRAGRSGRRWRRESGSEGFLALLRPPSARPRRRRRAYSSPTSSSKSIWRGRNSRLRRKPVRSSARCMPRCWPIRGRTLRLPTSPPSRTRMRGKTGN